MYVAIKKYTMLRTHFLVSCATVEPICSAPARILTTTQHVNFVRRISNSISHAVYARSSSKREHISKILNQYSRRKQISPKKWNALKSYTKTRRNIITHIPKTQAFQVGLLLRLNLMNIPTLCEILKLSYDTEVRRQTAQILRADG